jgi:hypothetical protein
MILLLAALEFRFLTVPCKPVVISPVGAYTLSKDICST